MDAARFSKELFKSSCPGNKQSPSQMRREEAGINKYCVNISNQVSVEEAKDKNSTDKTKAFEVIEEVSLKM